MKTNPLISLLNKLRQALRRLLCAQPDSPASPHLSRLVGKRRGEAGELKIPSTLKTIKPKLMDVFLYNLLRMSKKSTIFAAAFLGMKTARVHIAVFASGEGTTLQALLDSQESSHYQVTLVVSNKECGALLRASRVGVPILLSRDWEEITSRLQEAGIELIVLAGYLAIIPETVCAQWAGKMINTHPSLLPKFGGKGMYGMRVHEAVLAAGEKESGCTVHYVSSAVDGGEVIAQVRVPVLIDDTPATLATRVQAAERQLLTEVVERLTSNHH